MKLLLEFLDLRWFQNETARIRRDLIVLRKALEKHLESLKIGGLAEYHTPIIRSLRRDIEAHERLLQRSGRKARQYDALNH